MRGPQEIDKYSRYPQAAVNSLDRKHFPKAEIDSREPFPLIEGDWSCTYDSPMRKTQKHLNGGTQKLERQQSRDGEANQEGSFFPEH